MRVPLFLDSNLAVLYTVGCADQTSIRKHKRTDIYDVRDFEIVAEYAQASSGVVFSPNVLTETSNLASQVREPLRTVILLTLAEIVKRSSEMYVESRTAVAQPDYLRLGITDSVLLTLAEQGGLILTTDLDLYLAALNANLYSINYNHVRQLRPDFQ